ncbi:hypothetical protein [Actinomycetospora termitidis]|uniref:Uncharacterized protein n=1 Tax=Actinomycetospora termitidis TaxID=3053470 RepID=A0ABT7MHD6_9PSEU|nr:hypothetical protein [Actinomycetospora sp. Odt1-22]MDL5159584.1 hypothetical protein [Actinomycetospora sp. Odt1-22]
MTPIPGEPLGDMITRLDGSGFSHSGIATGDGDGQMASAHMSFCRTRPFDLGGIRGDHVSHFWELGQSVYRLAVRPEVPRDPALERLASLRSPDDDGTFSVPKIVIVAIALATFARDLAPESALEVRRLAFEAARAWEGVPDRRQFYCAELVARLYDRPFAVSALEPVDPQRPAPGPPAQEGFLDSLLVRTLGWLTDDDLQAPYDRMLAAVEKAMPTFLDQAAVDILLSPFLHDGGPALAQGRRTPVDRPDDPAAERLPYSLVTPRMLLDAPWTADHVERIVGPDAPLAPPSGP